MVHPCCGSSLKQGTKFLAILSMTLSVLGSITAAVSLLMIGFVTLRSDPSSKEDPLEEIKASDSKYCIDNIIPEPVLIFLILLLSILNLFLAIMLFIGAEQEDQRVCFFWWRISFGLCLFDAVCLATSSVLCTGITEIVISSAELLRSVYELWVVKAFMDEMKITQERKTSRDAVSIAIA